jgi:hypothetical protein
MRIKKLMMALFACMVVGAAVASAAQAVVWKTGTTTLSEETVNVSSTGKWDLQAKLLGQTVTLTADSVECAGVCKILGNGHSSGKLRFTGVTVDSPANCTVRGPLDSAGTVTTEALTDQLKMVGETATYDEFFPEKEGGAFVTLVFEGSKCVFNELEAAVKGTVTGRTANTGVAASVQSITFNEAEQKAGGGKLTLGGTSEAILTGVADNELSGAHAGAEFRAE